MVRLVGMGPGSFKQITMEAIDSIKAADRVVAFGRIAAAAKKLRTDVNVVNRVEEVAGLLEPDVDNVILASGDPCFYGILDYLQRQGVNIDQVIPGLSSVQYMMAKLKKSWNSAVLMSFHGREPGIQGIKDGKTAVILADSRHTPGYISGYLKEKGIRGKIYAGFNLSYEDEVIVEKAIGEAIEDISKLALVVVENEVD